MKPLLLLFCLFGTISSYKILMFVPSISRSNLVYFVRISDLLVNAGHEVWLYRPYYMDFVRKMKANLAKDFFVPGPAPEFRMTGRFEELEEKMQFTDGSFFDKDQQELFGMMGNMFASACEEQLKDKKMLETLKAEKFDLAFANMYESCPFGIIHHLGIKSYIWLSSSVMIETIAMTHAAPTTPSYVPGVMTGYSDTMSFKERTFNFIGLFVASVFYPMVVQKQQDMFYNLVDPNFPSLIDLSRQAQLVFINSEELLDFARPILHKTIYIGGIGMKDPAPLDEKWEKIVNQGKDGVVLVSFGSVVNASHMPIEWKRSFLKTFAQFPNIQFVMKFETPELAQMPEAKNLKNVHIGTWVPQASILAHNKIRAFMTHGGYNSLLESAFSGVPIVCMPLFGDQYRNSKAAERHGFGTTVLKTRIPDPKAIGNALDTILKDNSYAKNAKILSGMMRKKPTKSEDLIVKWTEFLAEFQQIPNLQPVGAQLSFIKYHCLDVMAVITGLIVLILFAIFKAVCFVLALLGCKSKTKSKRD